MNTSFLDILEALNDPQREAVSHPGGPLLILAGPGSGKTRVITHRIAYLIRELGVAPWRIMAVTFTNKAAREMKGRLLNLVGGIAEDVTMGTFHAVCVRILRVEAEQAGFDRRFVIYDDDDQVNLIKRTLLDLEVDIKKTPPRSIQNAISQAKSQLIDPEEYSTHSYFEEVVRRVYQHYQAALAEAKALDFDDLIMRTAHLFRDNAQVREKYQERYLHLLIDEFQDTNVAQYLWARLLAGKHRNICVVGDPDQSIYSWRSADIRNILNFEQDYQAATVVYLEENYRSTRTILEAAGRVIAANSHRKDVRLWTRKDDGHPIVFREGYDEEEEAYYVSQELKQLTGNSEHRWGDCAVMYRTNAQSRALEEAMVRANIPYRLVGATRFYARREVKDVLAYLRLIHNPYDSVSLQRVINVPGRGIGARTVTELTRWAGRAGLPLYTALQLLLTPGEDEGAHTLERPRFAARTMTALKGFLDLLNLLVVAVETEPLLEIFDLLLDRLGYRGYLMHTLEDGEERWENIQELRAVAEQFTDLKPLASMEAFLENIALVADVDILDQQPEQADSGGSVTLITLHQAKGLEFPVVFIVGMEEGVFPHSRSFDDPAQMEEERRLAYVGFTRAKERLYLLRAFTRNLMGSRTPHQPSRFLRDIPQHLVELAKAPTKASGPSVASLSSDGWPPPPPPVRRAASPSRGDQSHPGGQVLRQRVEYVGQRPATAGRPAPPPEPDAPVSFGPGEHVRHGQFGEGIVVSCEHSRGDEVVTVAFKGAVGVKRLMLSFAPLERVE